MLANKSRGTKIELILAKLLWNAGIRYRKNDKQVHGTPDFTIRGHRVAIFCDGEFWHGRDWATNKERIKSNRSFWYAKIERNIVRDREITLQLEASGWKVFRFWESDIRKSPDACVDQIANYLQTRRTNTTTYTREMAVVSHYLHNHTSCSAAPFEEEAKQLLATFVHAGKLQSPSPYHADAMHEAEQHPYSLSESDTTNCYGESNQSEATTQHKRSEPSKPTQERQETNEFSYSTDDLNNAANYLLEPEMEYAVGSNISSAPFLPQEETTFTFVDLFAGIGGFRLALQHLGGRCVFCNEWEKSAQQTYVFNFGEVPFGDLTHDDIKQYIPEEFDILCASVPCQSFSLVSKKTDLERTRGTLFYHIAETIQRHRPKAFILETEASILTHDKGRTIETLLKVVRHTLGYRVPDPKVLCAADYQLPQDSKHAYIVGFNPETMIHESATSSIHHPEAQQPNEPLDNNQFTYPAPSGIHAYFEDIIEKKVVPSKYYLSQEVINTLKRRKDESEQRHTRWAYEATTHRDILHVLWGDSIRHERNFVIDHRLTDFTPGPHYRGTINREGIRRLTPREFARLQGFPDTFIIGIKDAPAYRLFEKATPVHVVEALAYQILKRLGIQCNHP